MLTLPMDKGRNVLVGVTGSVAAIKVPELVERLTGYKGKRVCIWAVAYIDTCTYISDLPTVLL